MNLLNKIRVAILVLGDILTLYLSLLSALILRYQSGFYKQIGAHLYPFTIIFATWLVIFYIAGLYDLRRLRNNLEFIKIFWLTLSVSAGVAVLFFYLIPIFGITPKTNLFLFLMVFAIAEILWRREFNKTMSTKEAPNKVIVINGNDSENIKTTDRLDREWMSNLGYEIVSSFDGNDIANNPKKLSEAVASGKVNLLVISRKLKNNPKLTKLFYDFLNDGVEIKDLPNFYELVARKIPLADLEESWFIENLADHQKFYDQLKGAWEFLAAIILAIILSPLLLLFAIVTKLSSPGPVIYKQQRVGRHGRGFTFYKFRTMHALAADGSAETKGAEWAKQGDSRTTAFGKFLRHTHLDELPQLWNIIKGNLSFVGPRPERPEFVKVLEEKIPYYEIRHLVKPGVTGWAQIHHRADLSEDDVVEKLQYDIYYIKNRSPILDLAIILKTIKTLFVTPE
ncbi:MAG: sugar transferase [Patescibacteria group bacterium]|nr:sugar transferase [Patescibacteria group bacterium]MDE2015283.1 sugar transferase [Patescibacteria group bacterium]MDE2227089.1 sugar transferase [Patescibacteria group bacterium]